MNLDNITEFLPWAVGLLSGVTGWIAGQQKQKIDMVSSQRDTINAQTEDVKNLYAQVSELLKTNNDMLIRQLEYEKQIRTFEQRIAEYEKEIKVLTAKLKENEYLAKRNQPA